MPKVPKGKAAVLVYIDENLWREFRDLVRRKHEEFKGSVSYEVEQALQHWLALHREKERNSNGVGFKILNPQNPPPKVLKAFAQVKEYLKEKYGYAAIVTGSQIPRKHIVEAVEFVRGHDPKTIEKWMSLFRKYRLIKPLSPEVFEVL